MGLVGLCTHVIESIPSSSLRSTPAIDLPSHLLDLEHSSSASALQALGMAGMKEGLAIGIDLGTTYSCAAVWRNGHVEIIPDEQGRRTTPSIVAFTKENRLIGDAALNQASVNPQNTIFDAKRFIGRRFSDDVVQSDIKQLPFKVISGPEDNPIFAVEYKCEEKKLTPEEVSSMVLARMKEIAEAHLGTPVKSAVISVPACFNDSQRQATKDAAFIAGLNVTRIISEPLAAAIAYALRKKAASSSATNVLIFDLGGGKLDVSLLTIADGAITVKATSGDTHLGGADFDNQLMSHFVREFERKNKKNINGNARALGRLRTACEKTKTKKLSLNIEAKVEIDGFHEGINLDSKITPGKFDLLNKDLIRKCKELVEKCLNNAQMEKSSVDDIVLVGGSTRIPAVQQFLQTFFNRRDLCQSINADEAIAYGAAVQAAILNGTDNESVPDLVLQDVTPLSLGVQVDDGEMSVVIPRNTIIPTEMGRAFLLRADSGQNAIVKVYEGESTLASDNNLLCSFQIGGIPPPRTAVPNIKVQFAVDADGLLDVGVTISKNKGWLRKEEIENMIQDAVKYKRDEELYKERALARNKLESYVDIVRDAIEDPTISGKLTPAAIKQIEDAMDEAMDWVETNGLVNAEEFVHKMEELQSFYEKLMIGEKPVTPDVAQMDEENKREEKEHKKAALAKSSLVSYVNMMRIALEDADILKKLSPAALKKIETEMELAMQWVDSNELIVEEEFHHRMEQLQKSYKILIAADVAGVTDEGLPSMDVAKTLTETFVVSDVAIAKTLVGADVAGGTDRNIPYAEVAENRLVTDVAGGTDEGIKSTDAAKNLVVYDVAGDTDEGIPSTDAAKTLVAADVAEDQEEGIPSTTDAAKILVAANVAGDSYEDIPSADGTVSRVVADVTGDQEEGVPSTADAAKTLVAADVAGYSHEGIPSTDGAVSRVVSDVAGDQEESIPSTTDAAKTLVAANVAGRSHEGIPSTGAANTLLAVDVAGDKDEGISSTDGAVSRVVVDVAGDGEEGIPSTTDAAKTLVAGDSHEGIPSTNVVADAVGNTNEHIPSADVAENPLVTDVAGGTIEHIPSTNVAETVAVVDVAGGTKEHITSASVAETLGAVAAGGTDEQLPPKDVHIPTTAIKRV